MTPEERAIRFRIAVEMVSRIYADCCKDQNVSKEDTQDFCYLVQDINKFADRLEKLAEKEG